MIPSQPETLGGSEHDRFKRFAKALLAVSKSEAIPIEQTLAKLESDRRKIAAKIVELRREISKRTE
jgi:hypothetical protein